MTILGDLVRDIRSKNAGPFWLTIDIFCHDQLNYDHVKSMLDLIQIADHLGCHVGTIQRFDLDDLHVIKLSLPRPAIQGTRLDRDMHGASFAFLLSELPLKNMDDSKS